MRIECSLSATSLKEAARKMTRYAESIAGKTDDVVRLLGEEGAERAYLYLKHVDTGETRDSIRYTHNGDSGLISVGGAAVWIEFGTGVVRNTGSGHPKKSELGMSEWGTYGKGHGADPDGWDYWINGEKYHTYGIEMNPFMYMASQDMRNDLLETAKEVFQHD